MPESLKCGIFLVRNVACLYIAQSRLVIAHTVLDESIIDIYDYMFVTGFWKTDQIVTLGLFYLNVLAQLMATLIHYTYIVPLPCLIDWPTFLVPVLLTL